MPYFLERISQLLYEEYGGNLRNHCVVFPSRRAGLYFLKYLSASIRKPAWSPSVMTISELFASFSDLNVADNEILLFELYKVYRKLNPQAETFDEFYFWGDMLISDFDDADKYLADASVLFRNVKDFKNIDIEFGDIEAEQAEIIKRFWSNFDPAKSSSQKSDFKRLWSILHPLYIDFRNSLISGKLAYEGMIFRDVVTRIRPWQGKGIKWEMIHFIGFNALNRCEQTLMAEFQKHNLSKFYWDYDNSYVNGGKLNSAGLFLSENLKIFRNDMPAGWNYDTLLSSDDAGVKRTIVETTSDVAQVKLLPLFLGNLTDISDDNAHHTAVILADENLLVPALTSLPPDSGDVNITMGYPLKMTNVYSLVKYLLNLHKNSFIEKGEVYFNYHDVNNIIRHQLINILLSEKETELCDEVNRKNMARIPAKLFSGTENLEKIFTIATDPAGLSRYLRDILLMASARSSAEKNNGGQENGNNDKLRNEFIYRVLLSLNRLETIVNSPEVKFKNETYIRILDRILGSQSVPFTGEPLKGIQIMGILETRALDFKNIIMLSVNDGVLPSVTSGSSFIPYTIREAFGLPVINHQESIYAYHFYRLLHRAENVTFVYNSDSGGLRTGEMSRFLIQMRYGQTKAPGLTDLGFSVRSNTSVSTEIERKETHSSILFSAYSCKGSGKTLSPTAINTWLNCRMRFYFRYVNGLKEPDSGPVEIDHALFGRVLHRVMKMIYEPFRGKEVTAVNIESIISGTGALLSFIERAINEEFGYDVAIPPDGNEIIMRDVLDIYLLKILNADRSIAPFRIEDLEGSYSFALPVPCNGQSLEINTGGNIDRVDVLSGTARIVDYKTGDIVQRIGSLGDLFAEDRKKDIDGWLQTLLYCEAYYKGKKNRTRIRPSVYIIKEITGERLSDKLRIKPGKNEEIQVDNYLEIRNEFLEGLTKLVSVIFDSSEPFRMTRNLNKCRYCPYRKLCQR